MSDLIISIVRTYVPIAVGAAIAWLATNGIEVDQTTQVNLVAGLTGLISAAYYGVARLLESKWPAFGYLLGSKKTPKY